MKVFIALILLICFSIGYVTAASGDCIKGDCANGQGSYTYRDSSMYVGDWKNGMRNGRGTYTCPGGSYAGQWKNDRFDGQGIYTYPDGSMYEGEWKNNKRTGQGIYTGSNRFKYVGQWKNDRLIGEGFLITADGRRFVGQFDKDGKLIGKYVLLSDTTKAQAALIMDRKVESPVPEKLELVKVDKHDLIVKPKKSAKIITPVKKTSQLEAEETSQLEKNQELKVTKVKEETSQPEKAVKTETVVDSNMFIGPNNMKFVYISPGTFLMGSLEDEPGKYDNETQHRVTLTKGFYMQTTEVTQVQWMTVMGKNPSYFQYCGDKCPVEQVSWNDVQQFIWRLNQLEGAEKYRLPTEAEWEYACRAGSTASSYAGKITKLEGIDTNLATVAWFSGNSGKKVHPVARKKANDWGLYDMHGNVSELCDDWYGEYAFDQISPSGPVSGIDRIVRGGGWNVSARHCRSACRGAVSPSDSGYGIGFRLVRMP